MTTKQQLKLKQQCHHLKPVVMIGQHGLTDNVMSEIEIALEHHELIKIKLASAPKEQRQITVDTILQTTQSELIQQIGNMLCLYRKSKD